MVFPIFICSFFCIQDYRTDSLSREATAVFDKSSEDKDAKHDLPEDIDANPEEEISSDQVPTLTLQEKLPINSGSIKLSSNSEAATLTELHEPSQSRTQEKMLTNGDLGSPNSGKKNILARKIEVKGNSYVELGSSTSALKSHDHSPTKVSPGITYCLLLKILGLTEWCTNYFPLERPLHNKPF